MVDAVDMAEEVVLDPVGRIALTTPPNKPPPEVEGVYQNLSHQQSESRRYSTVRLTADAEADAWSEVGWTDAEFAGVVWDTAEEPGGDEVA